MLSRFFTTVCLACLATVPLWAQEGSFRPSNFSTPREKRLLEKMDIRLERDLDELPKRNKSEYKKIYTDRTESVKSRLTGGHFIFDPTWNEWFEGIMQEIWRGNPRLPKAEISLFIGRYSVPNASSLGEGSLVFNVGMLPFLENESQVAFILCHEIAHYAQDHSKQAIERYVETLYSDETQRALKDISKSEYGRTQRALDLLKTFAYSGTRHSRFKESEADSMAVIYLSNTRYNPAEAVRALQILDSTDSLNWPEIPYRSLFDSPQFPFRDSWLAEKKSSLSAPAGGFKPTETEEDSLKTHPDCQKRMALASQVLQETGKTTGDNFAQPDSTFQKLKKWAAFEAIEGLYFFEAYGWCLFRTLALLQQYPDDAYLNAMVGKCLFEIHLAQKEHRLGKVLERPDPTNDAEYDKFLRFMNQFRLQDLAQMNYYFVENRLERFRENEDFLLAAALASYASEQKTEFLKRKKEYLRKFPRGRFTDFLHQLN